MSVSTALPIPQKFIRDAEYSLDGQSLNALLVVMKRLHADRPLSSDERKDMANAMDAMLIKAVLIDAR